MTATSSGESYYCHVCETEVVPNLQDYTCSACHSGFIEVVSPGSGLSSDPSELDALGVIRQLWGGPVADSFVRYLTTSREDHSSTDDESLERENLSRRSRRSTRNSNQRSTRERVYTRGRPTVTTRIHLSNVDQQFLLPLLSTFGPTDGDMRNFVFNRGVFDQFITSAIADLPVNVLSEEQALRLGICSICFDDFKEAESTIVLPCTHIYHQTCVTTWLKQHGTCPVCRKDLAGRDTSRFEDPASNVPQDNGSSSSNS
ncbi:unnamed protein product [Heterobilharzia americana]|nr:unnamed protein product [Heterobilharzia americana]